jgi:hypothetical protein
VVDSGVTDAASTLQESAFCHANVTTKGLFCPPLGPDGGTKLAQDTNNEEIATTAAIIAPRFVAFKVVRIFISPLRVVLLI